MNKMPVRNLMAIFKNQQGISTQKIRNVLTETDP